CRRDRRARRADLPVHELRPDRGVPGEGGGGGSLTPLKAGKGSARRVSGALYLACCEGSGWSPAAAGRPFRLMSPGTRLRRMPPPLLPRKGLPATTGLGDRAGARRTGCQAARASSKVASGLFLLG